jgi:hypothetical protein
MSMLSIDGNGSCLFAGSPDERARFRDGWLGFARVYARRGSGREGESGKESKQRVPVCLAGGEARYLWARNKAARLSVWLAGWLAGWLAIRTAQERPGTRDGADTNWTDGQTM